MKCPYKYKYEFVDWLIRYKGWTKSAAQRLKLNQLRAIYFKNTRSSLVALTGNRVIPGFEEACKDYQIQLMKEEKENHGTRH